MADCHAVIARARSCHVLERSSISACYTAGVTSCRQGENPDGRRDSKKAHNPRQRRDLVPYSARKRAPPSSGAAPRHGEQPDALVRARRGHLAPGLLERSVGPEPRHHLFRVEAEDKSKKKFYVAIVYPYMSGLLHLGHLFTYTFSEIVIRYKRMQGFNVLAKYGYHCTGTPIVAAAQRVKEKEPKQIETLKKMGIAVPK